MRIVPSGAERPNTNELYIMKKTYLFLLVGMLATTWGGGISVRFRLESDPAGARAIQ